MTTTVLAGHVVDVLATLPEKHFALCVTSPPYWGLRRYGCEPQVFGGDAACAHVWNDPIERPGKNAHRNQDFNERWGNSPGERRQETSQPDVQVMGQFCTRCGAWRGELGSEPTPELFVAHLVECFEAVKRVLRDDGTLWVNLGDSFYTNPGGQNGGFKSSNGTGPSTLGGRTKLRELNRISAKAVAANAAVGRAKKVQPHPSLREGDLCLIPFRFAAAMQAAGWTLRQDCAWLKCLSGGARVYARTYKGDMPMLVKDLVRLDPRSVQLWNGEKWTRCVAWSRHQPTVTRQERHAASRRRIEGHQDRHEADYLELVFRNGERVGCTPEHRWPTQRGLVAAADLVPGDVVPTTRLPEPEEARVPSALEDADIGWFVGFYLAEGHKDHKTITFAMHAKETDAFARIDRIARAFHGSANWHVRRGLGAVATVYGRILHAILDTYIIGTGADGKHLTTACWQRSNDFLRALLDGYLEGDGHYDAGNRRWRLGFTRNYELEASLRTLAARIGATLRLVCTTRKLNGRDFPTHHGDLRLVPLSHPGARKDGEIATIRASRARQFWDIAVEDEPHLFALASGLLTHNSSPLPESVSSTRWERCRVKVAGSRRAAADAYQDGAHASPGGARNGSAFDSQAAYAPCPGCPTCRDNDGLVLRRGRWRPTTAWEHVFLFSKKGARYFSDGEAVRQDGTMTPQRRFAHHVIGQEELGQGVSGGIPARLYPGVAGNGGRNLWSYFSVPGGGTAGEEPHYASFPVGLPLLLLRASTSPKGCCPVCSAPIARVVESRYVKSPVHGDGSVIGRRYDTGAKGWDGALLPRVNREDDTLGWRPTCRHPEAVTNPARMRILDPFAGSGTTLLAAEQLGLEAVGVDLQPDYAAMARRRLALAQAQRSGGGRARDGTVWQTAALPLGRDGLDGRDGGDGQEAAG